MILKKFINMGWYTIPLTGSISRNEDGKKDYSTITFPQQGLAEYYESQNKYVTKLAQVITGRLSGITVLDCDNMYTLDMFRELDPNYEFIFISTMDKGGNIVYKYDINLPELKLNFGNVRLEVLNKKALLLPTENNFTKVPWTDEKFPELKEMPGDTLMQIKTLVSEKPKADKAQAVENKTAIMLNFLQPLLKEFVESNAFNKKLFRVITPIAYRGHPIYKTTKTLHPNDIPENEGSAYLSMISCILGKDISVKIDLYRAAMMTINSLWTTPMSDKRLNDTIIKPMIQGNVKINGEVVWRYDEFWKSKTISFVTRNDDLCEVFYDDVKTEYFLVNYSADYVHRKKERAKVINEIEALTKQVLKVPTFIGRVNTTRTFVNPTLMFGHNKKGFNLFNMSDNLALVNGVHKLKDYKHPIHVLRFLEHLFIHEEEREYFIRFLKTKLTTFEHSPVIPYLIGVSGSGKDTLIDILKLILNEEYVKKPSPKNFLEIFNGWIEDAIIVQLDEYGDTIVRQGDKSELYGKLKSLTGSSTIMVRPMREISFQTQHYATFIMTSNRNPLVLDKSDRRFFIVNTPVSVENSKIMVNYDSTKDLLQHIWSDISNFCQYLCNNVQPLSSDEYNTPPNTKMKQTIIEESIDASRLVVDKMLDLQLKDIYDLAVDNALDLEDLQKGWCKNRVFLSSLNALVHEMNKAKLRPPSNLNVRKICKEYGLNIHITTIQDNAEYYFTVNNLGKAFEAFKFNLATPKNGIELDNF